MPASVLSEKKKKNLPELLSKFNRFAGSFRYIQLTACPATTHLPPKQVSFPRTLIIFFYKANACTYIEGNDEARI